MVDNSSGSSSAKQIRITKMLKLQAALNVQRNKWLRVTVQKFEEISSFEIRHLKQCLPLQYNVVTEAFLTEVPR